MKKKKISFSLSLQDKNKQTMTIVFFIFATGILLWLVQFWINFFSSTPPHILNNGVFHQDYRDSFADFFNINCFIQNFSPYLNGNDSSYPPFNFLIALPFVLIMKIGQNSSTLTPLPVWENAHWQDWLSLSLLFALYVCMIVLLAILFYKKYTPSPRVMFFIVAICLFSSPFLFLIERANYVFFTFFFVAIFLLCYDSQRNWVRWLSYLALAAAVATKMYPAIFALVLLKKKRYKDTLTAAGLSILLFFLPFFMLKGGFWTNLQAFLQNLQSFGSYERLSIDVSTGNCFRILTYLFGGNYLSEGLSFFTLVFRLFLFVACCIFSLFSKRTWQSITLLSLLVVIVPMPAMVHSLIFVLLGFVSWLMHQQKRKIDYWYAVLFFLLLTPLQFGYIIEPYPRHLQYPGIHHVSPHYIGLSVNTFLQGFCVILLVITICADILYEVIQKKKHTLSISTSVVANQIPSNNQTK